MKSARAGKKVQAPTGSKTPGQAPASRGPKPPEAAPTKEDGADVPNLRINTPAGTAKAGAQSGRTPNQPRSPRTANQPRSPRSPNQPRSLGASTNSRSPVSPLTKTSPVKRSPGQAPSRPAGGPSRSPGGYGGRFTLEPQGLTRERALEIAMAEMEGRHEAVLKESEQRMAFLHLLVGRISVSGLEEKLSGFTNSAFRTIHLFRKEEDDARQDLQAGFMARKARLKKIEVGEVDGIEYEELLDMEQVQRKKMEYLEDRTFCDVLALEKAMRGNNDDEERTNAIRRQNNGLHCVRLFDGCPFINPSHCPFHSLTWIDPKSLQQQHFQRKFPRLKYDKRQVERTYQQLIQRRTARLQNIDCRLFVSRMEKGLSPSTL